MNCFQQVKQVVYPIVSKYFSYALLVEGSLKDSKKLIRCLFIDNFLFAKYLIRKTFVQPPHVLQTRRIWIGSLKRIIENAQCDIDICIAVLPVRYESVFRGLYNFKSQEWVRQVLDIQDSWEAIEKRFHKNPIETKRKIRKYNLTFKITRNLEDFNVFYYKMYLPHIMRQFGNISDIDSYKEMKCYFLSGFLLFVMDGEQPIAGGLCLIDNDILVFRRLGVLDGNRDHLHKGAQSAIYYFIIRYAKEEGFKKVDLMKSRPFLDDGVYRHKREWGASVYPDDESETWVYFFNLGQPEKISYFYQNNPVIIYTDKGLRGLLADPNEIGSHPGSLNDVYSYSCKGLRGFNVITLQGEISLDAQS